MILLYVGRVSVEKNLDLFAAAHDRARAAGLPVRAAVVGDGVYTKTMQKLLPDAIFTGYLSGEPLAHAYASADLFVFPSISDTFGNVVIEAQASGLPVIVSDQKGPQELVENGVTGLVTRGLDVEDLTAAIERLARDAGMARADRRSRAPGRGKPFVGDGGGEVLGDVGGMNSPGGCFRRFAARPPTCAAIPRKSPPRGMQLACLSRIIEG